MKKWTNLSYANVATTSPKAHLIASEWATSLARGGAAEFDADAEKKGMIPLRKSTANLLECPISDVCVSSSATELLSSLAWAIAPKKTVILFLQKLLFHLPFILGKESQMNLVQK